jgi:hypothetical protein
MGGLFAAYLTESPGDIISMVNLVRFPFIFNIRRLHPSRVTALRRILTFFSPLTYGNDLIQGTNTGKTHFNPFIDVAPLVVFILIFQFIAKTVQAVQRLNEGAEKRAQLEIQIRPAYISKRGQSVPYSTNSSDGDRVTREIQKRPAEARSVSCSAVAPLFVKWSGGCEGRQALLSLFFLLLPNNRAQKLTLTQANRRVMSSSLLNSFLVATQPRGKPCLKTKGVWSEHEGVRSAAATKWIYRAPCTL